MNKYLSIAKTSFKQESKTYLNSLTSVVSFFIMIYIFQQLWQFIYGGSGYGKTHLIQAIGNEIHDKYPDMNVLYVTIEQFYGDFVYSIQNKKLEKLIP